MSLSFMVQENATAKMPRQWGETPKKRNSRAHGTVIRTHRSVVGTVGNAGRSVFQAHSTHPVAREQFAFDEVRHFAAHIRRKVVCDGIAHVDVIKAMPQFDTQRAIAACLAR